MARKLPWSASANVPSAIKPAASRPLKCQRTEPADPKQGSIKRHLQDEPSSDGIDTKAKCSPSSTPQQPNTRDRKARSPSTSPPPEPPPIEFMREGLDADDVYMMVEDEFHTIAQSFTAQLHHAEYKRLMREARERNSRNRNVLSFVPKDATDQTKVRMRGDILREKQSTGLKEMVEPGLSLLIDSDEEGIEQQVLEEEENIIEPWAGTSLARLMNWDSSQRTSLKGLQKIKSDTRAARKLQPNAGSIAAKKSEKAGSLKMELADSKSLMRHRDDSKTQKPQIHSDKEDRNPLTEMAPSESRSASSGNTKSGKGVHGDTTIASSSKVHSNRAPKSAASTSLTIKKSKPKSFIDALDDWDDERFDRTQATMEVEDPSPERERRRIKREEASPRKIKYEKDSKQKKKDYSDRYDEIPLFLV